MPLSVILFFLIIGPIEAQTFKSVENGNWNSSRTWATSNGCSSSYSSPPPTGGYNPNCPIDIIVSHAVTFSGNSEFGTGYFRSITVKQGGILKFNNDFVLSTGGSEYTLKITVENGGKIEVPNGSFKFQRNGLVDIQDGGILAVKTLEGGGGNGGTLQVKPGGSFISSNLINLNNGLRLKIEGTLEANKLISEGGGNTIQVLGEGKFVTSGDVNINGLPFTASGNSRVTVGGNLSVTNSGESRLYINGKSNWTVSGKTTIANHLQIGEDAIVAFSNEVEITGSGAAMLEVKDQGDVLITGNLKKPQYSGGITVKNTGQLVICGGGVDGGSGAYPPTSHSNMNIAPSPAYYGGCTIMPVEFASFKATFEDIGRKSTLTWATAKEWQNSHFEIERSIHNISDWETIGQVSGNGFTDSVTAYSFSDNNLPAGGGRIFYRVKQVNFDGKSSYSATQAVQIDASVRAANWAAYPNPTSGADFRLELTNPGLAKDTQFHVILSSAHGNQELITGTSVDQINEMLKTSLTQKIAGIYLIKILGTENSETITIIKN